MFGNKTKKPLYRKVNTKARGIRHNFGGDFKYSNIKLVLMED